MITIIDVDKVIKREGKMNKELNRNEIEYWIEYRTLRGENRAGIKLISEPIISKKIKYGIMGDNNYYTFEELKEKFKKLYFKKGDVLRLFVVNDENNQRKYFGINISEGWPHNLTEDTNIKKVYTVDISTYLKKIGIF